jgi:alpha-maltose-1-phosphate synthase
VKLKGNILSGLNRNTAIFYELDGYTTTQKRLLGRQVAGESFLRGFVRASGVENFYCLTDHPNKFAAFTEQVGGYLKKDPKTTWINPLTLRHINEPGCVFFSGPNLAPTAWQRRHFNTKAFSLCGLTHTTCSQEAMQAFGDLVTGPLEEWDAVICTSQSVKKTMEYAMGNWADYLGQRTNGKMDVRVQLPVIPLGINCDEFDRPHTADKFEKYFREEHGIKEDDVIILYVGRLATHAKAHPLPMYQALEIAAAKTTKKIHLVQAGWFAADAIENQFVEGAKKFCPSVNAIFIDGRPPEVRQNIWHIGDIFTTLADNIQETFGITPLEAMATGMPVVATDWDGYRETIRDGIDGFLVRTTMPEPGAGIPLAYRYQIGVDSYDRYIGQTSLFTNVDTSHCADLYLRLIENPELRKEMGAAGKKRANEVYDWMALIPQYQDLWADLAARRQSAKQEDIKIATPLVDDPFASFEHYPTQLMTGNTTVSLVDGAKGRVADYLFNSLGNGVRGLLPSLEMLEGFLESLQQNGDLSIAKIATRHGVRVDRMILYVGWLAKMNLITVLPDGS